MPAHVHRALRSRRGIIITLVAWLTAMLSVVGVAVATSDGPASAATPTVTFQYLPGYCPAGTEIPLQITISNWQANSAYMFVGDQDTVPSVSAYGDIVIKTDASGDGSSTLTLYYPSGGDVAWSFYLTNGAAGDWTIVGDALKSGTLPAPSSSLLCAPTSTTSTAPITSASVAPPATSSAPPPTRSASCPAILFVGIRGSGQTKYDNGGYGNVVDAIRSSFAASIGSSISVKYVPLDYPSDSVLVVANLTKGGLKEFLRGEAQGAASLTTTLANSLKNCTGVNSQKWVIAGYSQGVMVAEDTLNQLSKTDAAHVAAIETVADPYQQKSQPGTLFGTAAPNATGIDIYYVPSDPPFSAQFKSMTQTLCDEDDPICDYKNLLHDIGQGDVDLIATAHNIHTRYPSRDPSMLKQMGQNAANKATKAVG